MFGGICRFSELQRAECSDITFNAEGMVINVQSSKTDQYREGASLLCRTGGTSYSRLRELLLDKIAKLGLDPALFGMHSLHAGGTTAAANGGEQDRLFK